jgi:hypothetical protein
MKTAVVILYILNVAGGSPVKVADFNTMSECLDAMERSQSGFKTHRDSHARLVCIPLDRKKESD